MKDFFRLSLPAMLRRTATGESGSQHQTIDDTLPSAPTPLQPLARPAPTHRARDSTVRGSQPVPATTLQSLQAFADAFQPAIRPSFRVEDIRQKKLNACSDACINVLLAFHGLPHQTIGTNNRPLLQGVRTQALVQQLEDKGLVVAMLAPATDAAISTTELTRWLGLYGPLLCGTPDHYIVVTGFEGGSVSIHCPLLGARTGTLPALNAYLDWSDEVPPILGTSHPGGGDAQVGTPLAAPLPHIVHRAATQLLGGFEEVANRDWTTVSRKRPAGQ